MKPLSIFYIIPVVVLIAVSCTSTRPINDNNVYMMKTSALPVGENLTDETSYATFKHREETTNPVAGYYNPRTQSTLDRDPRANNNSLFLMGGLYQGSYNPWWGMHRNGIYNEPGLGGFSNYYGNSFGIFNTYSWQHGYYTYPNGQMYPIFVNNYYGSYWNNYNGFGYGNSNYCLNNGYNFNGLNPNPGYDITAQNGNFVSGPRSTNSGIFSGTNRGGTAQLKSAELTSNTYQSANSQERNYTSRTFTDGRNANNTPSYRRAPTYARTSNGQTGGNQSRTYTGSRSTITTRTGTSRGTYNSGSSRSNSSGSYSGNSRSNSSGSSSNSSGSSGGRSGGSSGSTGRSGGRGN